MPTTFEKLIGLLTPPSAPVASTGDWAAVERDLGLPIPSDYKWFIETYGSGKINSLTWVLSPFADKSLRRHAGDIITQYEHCKDMYDNEYDFFPVPGGLLPFAGNDNANYINWETKGAPDDWRLVIWDGGKPEFELTEFTSIVEFILDILTRPSKLQRLLLPNFSKGSQARFEPAT